MAHASCFVHPGAIKVNKYTFLRNNCTKIMKQPSKAQSKFISVDSDDSVWKFFHHCISAMKSHLYKIIKPKPYSAQS